MLSENTQTTLFYLLFSQPFSLMKVKAACKTAPAEPPTNRPSFLINFLALVRDETSSVFTQ